MINGGEYWGTCAVRVGEGPQCHDDGRSVTIGHDGLKMVTGRYWDGNGNGNWTKS